MRLSLVGICVGLLLIALACTYTLDEPDFTVDVKPAEATGSVSLVDYLDKDTITIYKGTNFHFEIKNAAAPAGQFDVYVYLDDMLVREITDKSGDFAIVDNFLKTGIHKLKIKFTSNETDNSLAGHFLPAKVDILWKEWTVVIDVDPPPIPVITTSVNEQGYLVFSWPEYEKEDFQLYHLTFPGHSYFGYKTVDIADASKNSFVDTTYIGGYRFGFNVAVINASNVSENTIGIEEQQHLDMVFHPEDSTAHLTWRSLKYPGALKSYVISDESGPRQTITSPTDTTFGLKVIGVFPLQSQLHFEMNDKFDVARFSEDKYIDYFMGNAISSPGGNYWYYSKAANRFITSAGKTIKIYDDSFNLVASLTSTGSFGLSALSVPWPGHYLYYISDDYHITKYNLLDGTDDSITIPGDFLPAAYTAAVSGSDSQLLNFLAIDNDHIHMSKDFGGFVDMSTNTVLQRVENGPYGILSDDGQYINVNDIGFTVRKVNGGGTSTTLIGLVPNGDYFRFFRSENPEEFVATQYDAGARNELATIIYRSSDLTELRRFPAPDVKCYLNNYDPITKNLLFVKINSSVMYVVNIETGKTRQINASGNFATVLYNGVLINGGRYIKVL
jgi:hypothetical protein